MKFVDFEDVAVLGQSNHRRFPEVGQWTLDISLAFSGPDWSNGFLAQEVHGCVSVGRDLSFIEELPWGHRWVPFSKLGFMTQKICHFCFSWSEFCKIGFIDLFSVFFSRASQKGGQESEVTVSYVSQSDVRVQCQTLDLDVNGRKIKKGTQTVVPGKMYGEWANMTRYRSRHGQMIVKMQRCCVSM